MGTIGVRKGQKTEVVTPPAKQKQKRDNTTHHTLCCLAAKWLQGRWSDGKPFAHYAAVELVTQGCENTDVFGFNPMYSTMIEVKISRADFLRDKQKYCEQVGRVGDFKYYCCPEGVIKIDDLPEKWGLIYVTGGNKIQLIKKAEMTETNTYTEHAIICSIMRREGIKNQVFNYRK